ncbi:MAG: hypothetical protein K940chlam2_01787 [Chlamydiae bacterium]|nr:hypothetical protein [Chlamydiota bacterium]
MYVIIYVNNKGYKMAVTTHHSNVVDITLPGKIDSLEDALFPLHRQLEGQYRPLPWPAQMQRVVVLTEVKGGRGDIAAAAKAIGIMQRICPTLSFDWVLAGGGGLDPISFSKCEDPSKVSIRYFKSAPLESTPADFLLGGPVKPRWGQDYIESGIGKKIAGPIFNFAENATESSGLMDRLLPLIARKAVSDVPADTTYQELHSYAFPTEAGLGLVAMGLQPGSGVLLDKARKEAPLSREYCCPSYIAQIQDEGLRNDILEAMQTTSTPDYDRYSFNFGYAHSPNSWGNFIDCVALHEQTKEVVIVLNQDGEFTHLTTERFRDRIFTEERLAFLEKKGYSSVILKGVEDEAIQVAENDRPGRSLTVIVRTSFAPSDMAPMQLAAERILATGDNSAVEAFCARCQLYLYEDVSNGGCKWRFLQQQVDLAKTISPNLGKLLALFGDDRRLEQSSRDGRMAEIEPLLQDPDLGKATLALCTHITENYSFDSVLEGALKRTAWHHVIPELATIEAETLDQPFREGLVTYLQATEANETPLQITTLPELGDRIHAAVQRFLSK